MSSTITITPKTTELIVPSHPTPHEIKAVSLIDDQESYRINYPIIMNYKDTRSLHGSDDPVDIIKRALAKTLVFYYPYAGRLVEGPGRRLMVYCNAQGVVFVEADADVSLEELGDTVLQPPCPYSELLPSDSLGFDGILDCPLMLVQATRLTCGGLILAIRFNHIISDAAGSLQLMNAMSEIAKGASAPSLLPVWRRELLNPRHPPRATCTHPEYEFDTQRIIPPIFNFENTVKRAFKFGRKEIEAIRSNLAPEFQSTSKFDVVTSCVWRSRTRALQYGLNDHVCITCIVDARGKNYLDLPDGYYGNALVCPGKVMKVETLLNGPLHDVIKLVREARKQANKEYARSTIDYIAMNGKAAKLTTPQNFVVSDTSKLGFDEVDFGWGKPSYGGIMDGVASYNITYSRVRNGDGEGMVLVPMALPATAMEEFENELKRLIWGKHSVVTSKL